MKSGQRRISRHLWPNMMVAPCYPRPGKGKGEPPPRQPPPWLKIIDIYEPRQGPRKEQDDA